MCERMRRSPWVVHIIPTEPGKSILEHDRPVTVVQWWGLAEQIGGDQEVKQFPVAVVFLCSVLGAEGVI